mmetsp:Transcript_7338/g.16634  ORF Transcript_7338/g.16634 Transcript_7338/m.16634 type:complete len:105 (+) Transcript_7338:364-678(+)
MPAPIKDAKVKVSREEVIPAPAPDSDTDAHIMKSTKNHSLPKLKMSSSPVSVRRNVQKKLRNSMLKQINTGPVHRMKPLLHLLYTFRHIRSQFSGYTSSCRSLE